jgi:hypothetical protein
MRTAAFILACLLLGFCPYLSSAQSLEMQNPEESEKGYEFLGWDFSGMTEEATIEFEMVLDPVGFNRAWDNLKTSEEKSADEASLLAITAPQDAVVRRPPMKRPGELEEEAAAAFAILNPEAHRQTQDSQKSREELEEELFGIWSITHPEEYQILIAPARTLEQLRAEAESLLRGHVLQGKPLPVLREVTLPVVPAIRRVAPPLAPGFFKGKEKAP